MTAMENSGPNLDTLEVYPNGAQELGHWRGNFDNSGTFFVNGQQINDPSVTGWDITNSFSFTEPCDRTTVYAIHAEDYERSEEGNDGVLARSQKRNLRKMIQYCRDQLENRLESKGRPDSSTTPTGLL